VARSDDAAQPPAARRIFDSRTVRHRRHSNGGGGRWPRCSVGDRHSHAYTLGTTFAPPRGRVPRNGRTRGRGAGGCDRGGDSSREYRYRRDRGRVGGHRARPRAGTRRCHLPALSAPISVTLSSADPTSGSTCPSTWWARSSGPPSRRSVTPRSRACAHTHTCTSPYIDTAWNHQRRHPGPARRVGGSGESTSPTDRALVRASEATGRVTWRRTGSGARCR
jgi:hypothetical protein